MDNKNKLQNGDFSGIKSTLCMSARTQVTNPCRCIPHFFVVELGTLFAGVATTFSNLRRLEINFMSWRFRIGFGVVPA